MDLLVVLGFGGHARSVGDVALAVGHRQLIFLDSNAKPNESFIGFPALTELPELHGQPTLYFPASGDNERRERQVLSTPHSFATLVSPMATVGPGAQVATAALVAHHAHVGPLTVVGRGALVNTGAVVEHECVLGDFVHISVNATVAGRVRIGRRSVVGAGAVVINGISVCDDVVVGAGAVVASDILEAGTYVGIPARRIR